MRKLAAVLALATTALAAPAMARDGGWYVGLDAGALLAEDSLFDLRNATGTVVSLQNLKTNYEIGYDVDGTVGYDFGIFRTEFELAYKNSNIESINILGAVPAIQRPYQTVGVPNVLVEEAADGNAEVLSFMLNGMFDFGGAEDSGWGGFIGGGVGIARVSHANFVLVKGGTPYVNDSDTGFAWQLLAGVKKSVSPHVDVSLKYRYFVAPNVQTFTTNAVQTDSRYRSNSLLLGFTYNFFEDEPVAPPMVEKVAPPPIRMCAAPTPAAPAAIPAPGPFQVFFDWDRSVLLAEAQGTLDSAAAKYAETGQTSVALAGYADTSGLPDYNVALSQRRVDAVKAYLATKGVPEGAIVSQALGETNLLVATADGVREPQNRRVEITFSGAPQPVAPAAGPDVPCDPQ